MDNLDKIKLFLEPKSVAILGVSRDSGEGSFNILDNLLSYGYEGKLYPVNPNASEILGIKAYSNLAEIGEDIDLAIVNLPRS